MMRVPLVLFVQLCIFSLTNIYSIDCEVEEVVSNHDSDSQQPDISVNGKKSASKITFGEANPPSVHVPIIDKASSMSAKSFFSSYVVKSEAVLFKGAILKSVAYQLWNDDYFMKMKNIPVGHDVLVESRKKENRTNPPVRMPFKEFVQIYNLTDQYMVESVPIFLKKDYMLPHHMQCEQLMKDIIIETLMWFSSGGTSSVVHTDSVENMNCLVAGRKRFVFVPPKYADLVLFDHPEGAYSGIDVDDVDYTKYPGLAEVKFMHADLEAGDCLYIPFKWIHQVRSYERNIAVNIWWDTSKSADLDLNKCDIPFDPNWTLDRAEILGFSALESSPAMIRNFLTGVIGKDSMNIDVFVPKLNLPMLLDPEFIDSIEYGQAMTLIRKIFDNMDINGDKKVDVGDLEAMSDDRWHIIIESFNELSEIEDAAEIVEEGDNLNRDEL